MFSDLNDVINYKLRLRIINSFFKKNLIIIILAFFKLQLQIWPNFLDNQPKLKILFYKIRMY
jgi:hypothetical protein